jgi:hypothetical protein
MTTLTTMPMTIGMETITTTDALLQAVLEQAEGLKLETATIAHAAKGKIREIIQETVESTTREDPVMPPGAISIVSGVKLFVSARNLTQPRARQVF